MKNVVRAAIGTASAVAVAVAINGATAFAHIDPDPTSAPAGSVQSVGFTVEHGCQGSPTTQLDMRLPPGVGDASPEPPDGWTGTIVDGIVTFTGGPLPDDISATFRVRMTLPATPDTTIYFPFVQRCETGELPWIAIPEPGGPEPDQSAPAMVLTAAVPPPATITTTAAATVAPPAPTATVATTAPTTPPTADRSTTSTSDVVTSSAPPPPATSEAPATTLDTAARGETSENETIVFLVVLVVTIVGGMAVIALVRRRR